MKVRKLCLNDAKYMLEWMQDSNVTENLSTVFTSKTIEDCYNFIRQSLFDSNNAIHLAVCDDNGEYYGTVSLKNIDTFNSNAEYAISMRSCAMGKGYSSYATNAILKIAFHQLNLKKVYLYVFEKNIRAIKFYRKFGFVEEGNFRAHCYVKDEFQNLLWFSILREEFTWK